MCSLAKVCRSARRGYDFPDNHSNDRGFRLALVPNLPKSQSQQSQQTVTVQQTEPIKKDSHEAKHTNNNSSISQIQPKTTYEPIQQKPYNKQLYDLFDKIMSEMVTCPAGSFMMGSPETKYKQPEGFFDALFGKREVLQNGELGRFNNEIQHRVTISKDFKIGKYPVTQKLYEAVRKIILQNSKAKTTLWNV